MNPDPVTAHIKKKKPEITVTFREPSGIPNWLANTPPGKCFTKPVFP
jgi:hypothetical protein